MLLGVHNKYVNKILAIIGCFVVWLLCTFIFQQIIGLADNKIPAKKLDLKQQTFEIDQRVSICFKDVSPFSILLKQDENWCRSNHDLLVVVHTDPSNFKLRNEFRKILRKVKKEATIYNLKINAVFILGLDKDHCISSLLLQEISLEKDVLIGGFIDSNENQTLKSVIALKWFHEKCSNTRLLLKLNEKMDPSKSFSQNQFYKLAKYWKNKNIVLLGSASEPRRLLQNYQDVRFNVTTTSLYLTSPQHLHLNYLLSRYVVTSLLKARADAINISAWKEDLFVTGVLANVAQIRPEHDERFLRQCAGTLCIFCECFTDSPRQINFTRLNYFVRSSTKIKEPAQLLKMFTSQTDSTISTYEYMKRTTTYQPNESEIISTEWPNLMSSGLDSSHSVTTLERVFSTPSESLGVEITSTTENTPTPGIEVTMLGNWQEEEIDSTLEVSSHITQVTNTITEKSMQPLESENFMVPNDEQSRRKYRYFLDRIIH